MSDTPDQDAFPLYFQKNSTFVDLCRGPHLPSLDHLTRFIQVTKISGPIGAAMQKQMLTRVYGVALRPKKS